MAKRPLGGLMQSNYPAMDAYSAEDRPATPLNLIPQSSDDIFTNNLFEHLKGFFSSHDSASMRDLNNSLLPKDVNYYFTDSQKVLKATERVFAREKADIEKTVDDWLKQILVIFENFKAELFRVLDDERAEFLSFYEGFRGKIDRFLDESRGKLNVSMNQFDSFVRNVRADPNDPLDQHRLHLKVRRQQIDTIEEVFADIKKSYNTSDIPNEKKTIERIFIENEKRRSKVDLQAISRNVRGVIDLITTRLKDVNLDDAMRRPMSPIQSIAQGLNRPVSPGSWDRGNGEKFARPADKGFADLGAKLGLGSLARPKMDVKPAAREEKKVTFETPETQDRLNSDGKTRPKFAATNGGLPGALAVPPKDAMINIYKPSDSFEPPYLGMANTLQLKKTDPNGRRA